MTEEMKLLPCPFCGGEAEAICEGNRQPEWAVFCQGCDAKTPWLDGHDGGKSNAIAAWNRRAPSDLSRLRDAGRLDGLREAVQILLDTEEAGRTAKLEIMRRIVVANMPALEAAEKEADKP